MKVRTKRGRPFYGVVKFSKQRIKKLPIQGTAAKMASVLGVHRKTVLSWIKREGLHAAKDGQWKIHRPYLVDFLVVSGRYKRRKF